MSQDQKAGFLELLAEKLGKIGVDFEAAYGDDMKVICVSNIAQSLKDLSEVAKDHVVMVRVDEDTLRRLDSWIEAGVVKSRSEAALLFIREGLQTRQSELDEMESALADLKAAKAKLHERAQSLFGVKKGEAEK